MKRAFFCCGVVTITKSVLIASLLSIIVACGDDSSSSPRDEDSSSSDVVTNQSSSSKEVMPESSDNKNISSSAEISSSSALNVKDESSSSLNNEKSSSSSSLKVSSSSSSEANSLGNVEESSNSMEIPEGWSWDVPNEARLNPDVAYETMTDPRDSKEYRVVTIGTGENSRTWMAENLNYEKSGKCYEDVEAHCDVTGRLYTWGEASQVCPPNWHLPDNDDWNALFASIDNLFTGDLALKSQTGWENDGEINGNGLDIIGFCALPSGCSGEDVDEGMYCKKKFSGVGRFTGFWSATEYHDYGNQYYFVLINVYSDEDASLDIGYYDIEKGRKDSFSVRCVKDY